MAPDWKLGAYRNTGADQVTRFLLALLIVLPVAANDADLAFEQGMRFALAQQWTDARQAFLTGRAYAPNDKRFALELAGVAYRTGDRTKAIEELRRALAIDPNDTYANDAIGSLYLLEGRLDAAIPYWNRVARPRIHDVIVRQNLRRAVEVSPGEVLSEEQLKQTYANLERLGASLSRISLASYDHDTYDLVIDTADSGITGRNIRGRVVELASGLPYQTVNTSFHPGRDWIERVDVTLRWDPNKRLAAVAGSGLFAGNPHLRYILGAEGRDEDWIIRPSRVRPFKMTGTSINAEIEAGMTSALRWTNGFAISAFQYSGAPQSPLFTNGIEIKEISRVSYQAVRLPARHFLLTLDGEAQLGRLDRPFGKFQAGTRLQWALGETHPLEIHSALIAGASAGQLPFNELYALGMGRDNDLWIRGHTAEYNGRKGNAPMGDRYVLTQLDGLQTVYRNPFVRLEIGPFLDSGKVGGAFGSNGWMLDTGVQSQARFMGSLTVLAVYGRDVVHGGGVIFTAIRASR